TPAGYSNLCRLLTETHLGAERLDPQLSFAKIEARHDGLIILSGSRRDGLLPRILETEGHRAAKRRAAHCRDVFGRERFFVEIQRNRVRGDLAVSRALLEIASEVQLAVVPTGNVFYHTRELHRLQDVMVAIRHRTTLDGSHRVRNPNSEFCLRPLDEVVALFNDCPDAVAMTLAIAERCKAFDLTRDLGYTFPDFRGSGRAPAPQLAELCHARMQERYPPGSLYHAQALRRLAEELQLIEHHKLSGSSSTISSAAFFSSITISSISRAKSPPTFVAARVAPWGIFCPAGGVGRPCPRSCATSSACRTSIRSPTSSSSAASSTRRSHRSR